MKAVYSGKTLFGPQLVVEERSHQGWRLLDISGELDMATAQYLADALKSVAAGSQVILDMADVSFIDSVGLRTLIQARQDLGEASLHIVAPDGPVRRLLRLTRLEDSFLVSDSLP